MRVVICRNVMVWMYLILYRLVMGANVLKIGARQVSFVVQVFPSNVQTDQEGLVVAMKSIIGPYMVANVVMLQHVIFMRHVSCYPVAWLHN